MFIHGESYEWNAGSTYDGSVLASAANILVVTINYRLGILGEFSFLFQTCPFFNEFSSGHFFSLPFSLNWILVETFENHFNLLDVFPLLISLLCENFLECFSFWFDIGTVWAFPEFLIKLTKIRFLFIFYFVAFSCFYFFLPFFHRFYSVSIAGFYPSPDGSARGNFGLMDQVAALHWIQANIREFGGDERNVTIAGHGHGAACVNFLTLSPMARGKYYILPNNISPEIGKLCLDFILKLACHQ